MQRIGDMILDYRKENKLTQEQLAEKIHPELVKGYICIWEKNKCIPSEKYLGSIQKLLKLDDETLKSAIQRDHREPRYELDLGILNYVQLYNKFQESYKLGTPIAIENVKVMTIEKLMLHFPAILLLELLDKNVEKMDIF